MNLLPISALCAYCRLEKHLIVQTKNVSNTERLLNAWTLGDVPLKTAAIILGSLRSVELEGERPNQTA